MKHTESKKNTVLNQYLREKRKEGFYCYYELKVAKGLYFNFKNIEDNQDDGLPALQKTGLVWKFSDEDSRKKMCDGMSAPPLTSYLVIKFKTNFYFIKYDWILKMREAGDKSINEEECMALADKVFHSA